MSRAIAILLALGLLGAAEGCHHTHGVCDCEPGPIGYNGPPPPLAMALPPPRPEPIPFMPKQVENDPVPPATDRPEPVVVVPRPAEGTPVPAPSETPN
jgi:hypothetical protein